MSYNVFNIVLLLKSIIIIVLQNLRFLMSSLPPVFVEINNNLFKSMNFMICKLYLSKAVRKQSGPRGQKDDTSTPKSERMCS